MDDVRKGSSILEFFLRVPLWVPSRLISILPSRKQDLLLKKTCLLRRMCASVLKGNISEKILDSLEKVEYIDREIGTRVSNSMKSAYCAVAVDCAANFLRQFTVKSADRKVRVCDMERLDSVCLVSEWLRDLGKEMEIVIMNDRVRDDLLRKDTRKDALNCVWAYLEDAVQEVGPKFLELAAKIACGSDRNEQNLVKVVEMDGGGMELDSHAEEDMQLPLQMDSRKRSTQPRAEDAHNIGVNSIEEEHIAISKEANTSHGVNMGDFGTGNKLHCLPMPDVKKVQEALRSSSMNLQIVVRDPLPDSLKVAERLSAIHTEPANQDCDEGNRNQVQVAVHNSSFHEGVKPEASHVRETGTTNQSILKLKLKSGKEGISMPGFMSRNETARTYEWGKDSIDNSPSSSEDLHLHGSKDEKKRKWSLQEEEALRDAVKKHGTGRWTYILNTYREKFEPKRRAGDLKDKWRNMTK